MIGQQEDEAREKRQDNHKNVALRQQKLRFE